MNTAADVQLTFCNVPDQQMAQKIADKLVISGLAACVSLIPGLESVYRWKDELQHDQEVLLMIKACATDYIDIQNAILELHPFELPEIIAVPLTNGLPGYLQWVQNQPKGQE